MEDHVHFLQLHHSHPCCIMSSAVVQLQCRQPILACLFFYNLWLSMFRMFTQHAETKYLLKAPPASKTRSSRAPEVTSITVLLAYNILRCLASLSFPSVAHRHEAIYRALRFLLPSVVQRKCVHLGVAKGNVQLSPTMLLFMVYSTFVSQSNHT